MDLPVNPWSGNAPLVGAERILVADLNDSLVQRLKAFEEEMRSATDRNIVLVAYDNGPRVRQ
jgi:hypothetical protein